MTASTLLAAATVVPPLDPFGLPAPAWLFVALIIGTMLAHVIFMNFVLGGAILSAILDFATVFRLSRHNHTVRVMWQVMPVAFSLTITTGIAPLLFVQVLYGHFFYTASIFLGFVWLAIVPLLMLAFYGAYFISLRLGNALRNRVGPWDERPGRRLAATLVVATLIAAVAWVLSNNHMLSLQPGAWAAGGTWKQTRFGVSPATTIPRLAHFAAGAVGVAGLWLAWVGWWRALRGVDSRAAAEQTARTGLNTLLVVLVAELAGGPILFFTLPSEVRGELLAPNNALSLLWFSGVVGALGQIAVAWLARRAPIRTAPLLLLTAAALLTLVGMLAGRERVRLAYLRRPDASFTLDQWPVHVQGSSLVLFLVTLLLGVVAVAWLVRCTLRASPASTERTAVAPPGGAMH